jgi:chromosomal replication initiation ATPase DnaA
MVEITKRDYETIYRIEYKVCKEFNVSLDSVLSKDRKMNEAMARSFIIYILHKNHQIPASKIAKRYNCTRRNVFWHLRKVYGLIATSRIYKNMYEKVCNS